MLTISSSCNMFPPMVPVLVNVTQSQNVAMTQTLPPLLFPHRSLPITHQIVFFLCPLFFIFIFMTLIPASFTPHSLQSLFQLDINKKAYLAKPIPSLCPFKVPK